MNPFSAEKISLVSLLTFGVLLGCTKAPNAELDTSSSTDTVTLSGMASAGPIKDGLVSVYKLNSDGSRGSKISSTKTDSEGK